MSFTVDDYHDLVRLVQQHPEWKSELRQLLLSDELLSLPDMVRELTASHQRAEERLAGVEKRLTGAEERLARAEERLSSVEERLSSVEERLSSVEERLSNVEERLSRLEITVQNLAEQVAKLVEAQQTMANDIGGLKGRMLELTYQNKAGAYFGSLLRRMRLVEPHTLENTLESRLTAEEFRDVLHLDLLVRGEPRQLSNEAEVWLAVEVSSVIDQYDVDRADRRASLLRKAGYRVIPIVAGENITQGAEVVCHHQNVPLFQDGHVKFWNEALSVWANN